MIVPNLRKNTEMLCLCVLALCLTTQRHWPQNSLAKSIPAGKEVFPYYICGSLPKAQHNWPTMDQSRLQQ